MLMKKLQKLQKLNKQNSKIKALVFKVLVVSVPATTHKLKHYVFVVAACL